MCSQMVRLLNLRQITGIIIFCCSTLVTAVEIIHCCNEVATASMDCSSDAESFITLRTATVAKNNFCSNAWCCSNNADCQVQLKDVFQDLYDNITLCEGRTSCDISLPESCAVSSYDSSCKNRPFYMEYIRITYECTSEKEIKHCCSSQANEVLDCGSASGSVIAVKRTNIVKNNNCRRETCCTDHNDCEAELADKLPDLYHNITICEGITECQITLPRSCSANFGQCGEPFKMEYIWITYGCISAEVTPETTTVVTAFFASDGQTTASSTRDTTSPGPGNTTTADSSHSGDMDSSTGVGNTFVTTTADSSQSGDTDSSIGVGMWIGISIGILCFLVLVILLAVCLARRKKTTVAKAQHTVMIVNGTTQQVINNANIMDNLHSPYEHLEYHSQQQPENEYSHVNPIRNAQSDLSPPPGDSNYADYDLNMIENKLYGGGTAAPSMTESVDLQMN